MSLLPLTRTYPIVALAQRGDPLAFGWGWIALRHGWPVPHRAADWASWFVAFLAVATNLPAFLAEIAVPFPTRPRRSIPDRPPAAGGLS